MFQHGARELVRKFAAHMRFCTDGKTEAVTFNSAFVSNSVIKSIQLFLLVVSFTSVLYAILSVVEFTENQEIIKWHLRLVTRNSTILHQIKHIIK